MFVASKYIKSDIAQLGPNPAKICTCVILSSVKKVKRVLSLKLCIPACTIMATISKS